MAGLQKLCKAYGRMIITNARGESETWVWDYAQDKAVLKSEMTKEQFAASEKAKYGVR